MTSREADRSDIGIYIEVGGPLTLSMRTADKERAHTLGQVEVFDPINDRIILQDGKIVSLSRLDILKTRLNSRVATGIKSIDIQTGAIDPLTGLPRSSSQE